MHVILQHQQAGGEAGEPAADRRGDEIDALGINTHQRHDLAVLRDGADRGAGEGAGQEQIDADHAEQRGGERQQSRVAEIHLAERKHRQADAEIAEVDAEGDGGKALQDEQHAAGGEQLVDRRRGQQRGDHEEMQRAAEQRHQQDDQRRGGPVWQAVVLHEIVHAVHADHHKLGVADPGDVDDAEDQVEPEREQRQHAAEQDAVDDGLQQVDVEDVEEGLHGGSAP
ncbi:hypothetical protein BLN97_39260 [Bradyrhizobium elkanii]|nr:hypothetical protein BLN97_39260 [Bradyrhizobium elkanii]